jgi:hypothetical protein
MLEVLSRERLTIPVQVSFPVDGTCHELEYDEVLEDMQSYEVHVPMSERPMESREKGSDPESVCLGDVNRPAALGNAASAWQPEGWRRWSSTPPAYAI